MVIMLDTDFTEKNYEVHYFGYMDILGIIGGLNASIGPLLAQFAPMFIMNYLYQLAQLIIGKYRQQYHKELAKIHQEFRKAFNRINIEQYDTVT